MESLKSDQKRMSFCKGTVSYFVTVFHEYLLAFPILRIKHYINTCHNVSDKENKD